MTVNADGREFGRELGLKAARALILDSRPVTLEDGTTGYRMRRGDDCLQAAIATVLQQPFDSVPDGRLNERVHAGMRPEVASALFEYELDVWLRSLGLWMVGHKPPPWDHPRWIGVVPPPAGGYLYDITFADHCVVMTGDRILADPQHVRQNEFVKTLGIEQRHLRVDEIAYGITFEKRSK